MLRDRFLPFSLVAALAITPGCEDSGGADSEGDSGDSGGSPDDPGQPPTAGPELSPPEPMAAYYVSSSLGNDAWSGSLAEPNADGSDGPKATLNAAIELINGAAPGTHVLLRRGDEWRPDQQLDIGDARGTEDAPIVLGAYGDGEQPTITSTGTPSVIAIRSNAMGPSEHFWIHDIRISREQSISGQNGIQILEGFHPEVPRFITMSRLTIENHGSGLLLYGTDLLLHGSRIANNVSDNGIFTTGDRLTFQYNVFENNGPPPPDTINHSLYIQGCNAVLFEHNEVFNATDGLKVRQTSNSTFRHNTFHDIEAIGIHLGGDNIGGAFNDRIESNLFYDNSNAIVIKTESGVQTEPSDNIVVANNIVSGTRDGFVDFGFQVTVTEDPVNNLWMVNNLVYETGDEGGIRVSNSGQNIVMANNVVGKFTSGPLFQTTETVTDASNLGLASSAEFDMLALTDPGAMDFTPTGDSSMLIDQGMDMNEIVDADYAGESRPAGAGYDIGPYEYAP